MPKQKVFSTSEAVALINDNTRIVNERFALLETAVVDLLKVVKELNDFVRGLDAVVKHLGERVG